MILGMNALVLIVVACALLITILEQRQAINRLHESATRQAQVALRQAVEDTRRALIQAGQLAAAENRPVDLDAALTSDPALRALALVDGTGTEIAAAGDMGEVADWSQHPIWNALASGEADCCVLIDTDPLTLVIAVALADGALIAQADPSRLWADALSVSVGEKGTLYLVDDAGAILATAPNLGVRAGAHPGEWEVFKAARDSGAAMRLYEGITGAWVAGRAERIPDAGYTIIVETPLSEFAPLAVRTLALIALALALTTIVGEWLIRRILRSVLMPLGRLQDGARAVTAGDYRYRVRVPPNTDRELVDLGQTFNQMIDRLADSQRQIDAYTNEMQEIIDQRARELARKASQLEIAADVSSQIVSILDQRDLIAEVVDLITKRFQVYHVEILLVDQGSSRIVPSDTRRQVTLPDLSLRDAPHSIIAWVARRGQTLYAPDVAQEPRYLRTPDLPASQCELAIPLRFGNQVLGVLNLEADHRDAFPRDDIAVLESLANKIAVSLRNAQMFEQLETANRDLAQATMQANQANSLKSRFLFNASHKLRTPLNSIIGYSETIMSGMYGELPDKALDRQRRILDNGRALHALIEDMLDLSAIETGQMRLNLEWVRLPPLLEEIVNATRALQQTGFPDHALDVRLDLRHLTDPLPPVWADADRLRYILINLTGNAVKFTEAGEVVVSADFDEEWVRVHVRDTGPGIGDDERRTLFEPFQHQRGSTGVEGKGTGLGLPVSRLLAMRHGGDLTVESRVREGSVFTLNLPRRPDGSPPPPEK
jgi:signal transduction histidine kinase